MRESSSFSMQHTIFSILQLAHCARVERSTFLAMYFAGIIHRINVNINKTKRKDTKRITCTHHIMRILYSTIFSLVSTHFPLYRSLNINLFLLSFYPIFVKEIIEFRWCSFFSLSLFLSVFVLLSFKSRRDPAQFSHKIQEQKYIVYFDSNWFCYRNISQCFSNCQCV